MINYYLKLKNILNNIKEQLNEIICIYKPNKNDKEINLLYDYNRETQLGINHPEDKKLNTINDFDFADYVKLYLEAKNMNKNIFENYMDIYINDKKVKFDYIYKIKEIKEIKVKFIFKKILTNTSHMFYNCSSLESIDLSSFNATNVKDMNAMFKGC